MNNKEIIITATKSVIILTEQELFQGLRIDILARGLQRGKHYKRSVALEKREKVNLSPWHDEPDDSEE